MHTHTPWLHPINPRSLVQETVRKAADLACKTLTRTTVRVCDITAGATKLSSKVVEETLPVLLKTGMSSPADEVRAIR